MPAATGHYVFKEPSNPEIKIWRYMDFAKYVSFLESSALWFSRADKLGETFEGKLGDPYEGDISKATLAARLGRFASVGLLDAPDEYLEPMVQHHRNKINTYREWTYINSWHMNERESAAMWSLYARTNEAVAIQSTYARLRDCLPSNVYAGEVSSEEFPGERLDEPTQIYVGEVRYIDYETEPIPEANVFWPFIHKRRSFEHERELTDLSTDT
jgi:hypothetical protein